MDSERMEKELKCNDVCKNLSRFGNLYDFNRKIAYYPSSLLRFANDHYAWLQKLE
jgi:hypothetical protein